MVLRLETIVLLAANQLLTMEGSKDLLLWFKKFTYRHGWKRNSSDLRIEKFKSLPFICKVELYLTLKS